MDIISLLLLSIGLAMDAFAVSVALGLKAPMKDKWKISLKAGLFFGLAQGIMPLIGWLLGTRFSKYIESFDHWIAFGLLAILGGKMIYEALKGDDEEDDENVDTTFGRMFMLAIATSIDALAIGVSFAFLNVHIGWAVAFIGIVTFVISAAGAIIGKTFGDLFKGKAEIFGGVILIFLGAKILVEHLGLLDKIFK